MKVIRKSGVFFSEVFRQRRIIRYLIRVDFSNNYLSTYLGLTWVFLRPVLITLAILFALKFGFGLEEKNSNHPIILWILCGIIPWFFISDVIKFSTKSLVDYSSLIKSGNVKASIMPLIKIFSSIIVHLVFLLILAVVAFAYGYKPDLHWIQIIYLVFASIVLLTGIGWFISSINVFVRDISVFVNLAMDIAFWITPIIWSYHQLEGYMKYLALLNPFFYITEGYRYTFIQKAWMFNNTEMTVFFWVTTLVLFTAGAVIFKTLSPRLAEDL